MNIEQPQGNQLPQAVPSSSNMTTDDTLARYPASGRASMISSEPLLRSYPRNSAQAAARLVALALIANGQVKAVDTAVLDALRAYERLGLTRQHWHGVIHDLCTDLLGPARCGDEGCISPELLDRVLDEVVDDSTRRLVLLLCSAVVHADREIDDGESFVLLAAIERWGLHPDEHALLEPMLYGADSHHLEGRIQERRS